MITLSIDVRLAVHSANLTWTLTNREGPHFHLQQVHVILIPYFRISELLVLRLLGVGAGLHLPAACAGGRILILMLHASP